MAGVACALAAARHGARVVLCQDRPVLGGNASSEVRMHIVGANGVGATRRGVPLETEARETGILEELRLEMAVHNPQRSASLFDLLLYDKCRSEPNLTLMLNTSVVDAIMDGDRIQRVRAERQSTEDAFEIEAEIYVDCTGDGRLAYEAGAPFMEGREDRARFGESLAVAQADLQRLGSSILLQARKHDRPMPFQAPSWVRQFTPQELRLRLYATPGDETPTHEYGYWWVEWGGTLDTIKDNERIRDELLAIALGVWDHIKNGPPGSAPGADPFQATNWALDWLGFLPGKRESRRFVGLHVLTQSDLIQSTCFPDAIAYGGWSLDLHPPLGVDAPDEPPCVQHDVPYLYDIPLRCCVSQSVTNLMFAGRNLSATHVAFASTRVMGTCAVVGQGVGTAAAYAVHKGLAPSQLAADRAAMAHLQQQLLWDDCFLIGRTLEPSESLRQARLSASSQQPRGAVENVRSGQTRAVHGPRGVEPLRAMPGTHRWMSEPADALPAWIQLEWDQAVQLSQVQLVFDTGLHRYLTLSHHDGYTSSMHWGSPQSETVADYCLEALVDEQWRTVVEVRDNYQRLRRHGVDSIWQLTALRLTVLRTHGLDHARVVSIALRDA